MDDNWPVRQVSLYRDDGTTEYVLSGPTEGSLQAPLERIRLSYPNMNVAVGRTCMFRGEVQVSVMVTLT